MREQNVAENITKTFQFTEIFPLDETKAMTAKTIARLMRLRSVFEIFRRRIQEVLCLYVSFRAASTRTSVIFIERVCAKSLSNKLFVGRNANNLIAGGHLFYS